MIPLIAVTSYST